MQYKWLATRGVEEETILHSLPSDLRRDIQRHLCLDLVRRVSLFTILTFLARTRVGLFGCLGSILGLIICE